MNVMEIIRQIAAKNKAKDIIDSCNNADHWDAAEKYIKLYFEKFEDFLGKRELEDYLQQHKLSALKP